HSEGIFPSVTGFFDCIKKYDFDKDEDFSLLGKYIKNLTGKDIRNPNQKINIEDLFTHIEIELEHYFSAETLSIKLQQLKLIQTTLLYLQNKVTTLTGEY